MIRLTLTDDSRLIVHDGLRERAPSAAEAERVREALAAKPLPLWLDMCAVGLGVLALVVFGHGGGTW